jgi:hypothetical protein
MSYTFYYMARTLTITSPGEGLLEDTAKKYAQITGTNVLEVTASEVIRVAVIELNTMLTSMLELKKPEGFWTNIWRRSKIWFSKEGITKSITWKETKPLLELEKEIGDLAPHEKAKYFEARLRRLRGLEQEEQQKASEGVARQR